MRRQGRQTVVGVPKEQFFYPDLLNNYVSSVEIRIALDNVDEFTKIRSKKELEKINEGLINFEQTFIQPYNPLYEDKFYLKKDGTIVVGFTSFVDQIKKDFLLKLYLEHKENCIYNYQKQLRESRLDFKRVYSENQVKKMVAEYKKIMDNRADILMEDNRKEFNRIVWVYFYPNIRSAKGPKLFLTRKFLETGEIEPNIMPDGFIKKVLKIIFKKKKKEIEYSKEQLENRHIFMTRQILASKLGWNKVYSEKILRRVLDEYITEEEVTNRIVERAKKENKINTLDRDSLLQEYCKIVKTEYAKIILDNFMF